MNGLPWCAEVASCSQGFPVPAAGVGCSPGQTQELQLQDSSGAPQPWGSERVLSEGGILCCAMGGRATVT